jgi:hypothetical protein
LDIDFTDSADIARSQSAKQLAKFSVQFSLFSKGRIRNPSIGFGWYPELTLHTQRTRRREAEVVMALTENTASSVSFFYPEDGSSKFLRNVGTYLPNCVALYHRRQYSSKPIIGKIQNTNLLTVY